MGKIIIFNVPAEKLGALSILNRVYNEAINDLENEYVFVLSGNYLKNEKNIKQIHLTWIKKSWFHRLFFDYFIAHKIIKKVKPDKIISYHNMIVKSNLDVKQTIYLHNAIPFADFNFSFINDTKLWIYQKVIGRKIFSSIKKADEIVVQTEWLKRKILERFNIESKKIKIENQENNFNAPKINNFLNYKESNIKYYIYPAAPFSYKNHKVILEACKQLNEEQKKNINIKFTFKGDENKISMKIKKEIKSHNLPISLIGTITQNEVMEYYLTHQLIFSSKLETLGLPLLEAQVTNTPIIYRSDELFEEILNSYDKKNNFESFLDLKKLLIKE